MTGTINQGGEGGWKRGQFTGENSASTIITNKTFDEKMLLTELSNITFLMGRFKDKNIQKKQVDYNSDGLTYSTSKTFFSM